MKRSLIRIISAFTCLLLAVGAIACSDITDDYSNIIEYEDDSEGEIDEATTVIGFSQPGAESAWRVALTESVKSSFTEENGYKLYYKDGQSKQDNQIKDIRTFIQQGVDFIILSPIVETGWDQVLEEAKEAGIPVIICDRNVVVSNENLYTAYVGSNFKAEGETAISYIEKTLESKNLMQTGEQSPNMDFNIVHIQGTLDSSAQLGRSKALADAVEKNDKWNIIAQECGDFTKGKSREIMTSILENLDGESIDLVYCENDEEAFGVMAALNEAGISYGSGGDVMIVSFDGQSAALNMVMGGQINFEVECNPLQGPYLENIIGSLKRGKKVPKITYIDEAYFTQYMLTTEYIESRPY